MTASILAQYKELLTNLWQRRRENQTINDLSAERTRLWGLLSDAERLEVERWIESRMNEPAHVRP